MSRLSLSVHIKVYNASCHFTVKSVAIRGRLITIFMMMHGLVSIRIIQTVQYGLKQNILVLRHYFWASPETAGNRNFAKTRLAFFPVN